jgi:hypothetical protein
MTKKLEEFFAAYAARTNAALADPPKVDVEAAASAFADSFIGASPKGVNCGKNDDELRAVIPKGYEFYRSIGTKRMDIDSLTLTQLDDFHTQAKVHWVAKYQKQDGSKEEIEFDVLYFVQDVGKGPKIFAYITGDEEQVYKDKGLIPYQATGD